MLTKLIEFCVPGSCPSYNASFKIAYALKQVYLSREAKEFKKKVMIYCPPCKVDDTDLVVLELDFISSWICNNGKLRKRDCQNMDKLLVDALFTKLGIDDSHLQKLTVQKIHSSTTEKTIVRVYSTKYLPGEEVPLTKGE